MRIIGLILATSFVDPSSSSWSADVVSHDVIPHDPESLMKWMKALKLKRYGVYANWGPLMQCFPSLPVEKQRNIVSTLVYTQNKIDRERAALSGVVTPIKSLCDVTWDK